MTTAMATVSAAARPIWVRNGTPTTESAASAITTVRPANTTAEPAVPTGRPAARRPGGLLRVVAVGEFVPVAEDDEQGPAPLGRGLQRVTADLDTQAVRAGAVGDAGERVAVGVGQVLRRYSEGRLGEADGSGRVHGAGLQRVVDRGHLRCSPQLGDGALDGCLRGRCGELLSGRRGEHHARGGAVGGRLRKPFLQQVDRLLRWRAGYPELVGRRAGQRRGAGFLAQTGSGGARMAVTAVKAPDSRQRFIEAAIRLFARHSFAGTSLQMIADEVGVTKSAIHHHFRTREELFHAVIEPVIGEMRVAVEAAEDNAACGHAPNASSPASSTSWCVTARWLPCWPATRSGRDAALPHRW
jgi:hypothetical protein